MATFPDIIGYLCQCEWCGQRALTRAQHPSESDPFMCPACRAAGWGDVDIAQAEPDLGKIRG